MSDLISRETAKNYIDSQKGRPFIQCTIAEAMKIMLDEVPSAEPEERTAKVNIWVEEDWRKIRYMCDGECECGMMVQDNWLYCPSCGARLEL